jgi:uncharacterized membrane protein
MQLNPGTYVILFTVCCIILLIVLHVIYQSLKKNLKENEDKKKYNWIRNMGNVFGIIGFGIFFLALGLGVFNIKINS